jgi:hypothetical protein
LPSAGLASDALLNCRQAQARFRDSGNRDGARARYDELDHDTALGVRGIAKSLIVAALHGSEMLTNNGADMLLFEAADQTFRQPLGQSHAGRKLKAKLGGVGFEA